jgi:RimJ/RimL family protein N-acetyltransferase
LIDGKNISLRSLEHEDLQQLRDWRNSEHVRHTTREYRLLNMVDQERWFNSLHAKNPPEDIMFGIVDKKGALVGVCGLTHINWKNRNAEASIYIGDKGWQGKGLGKESLELLLEFGFSNVGFRRIWAEIFGFNEASIKLFESTGFKREGILRDTLWRDGKWWSSVIYSILQDEFKH